MTEKQYTGRLAPVTRWLDGVTDKDLMKGAGIVTLTAAFRCGDCIRRGVEAGYTGARGHGRRHWGRDSGRRGSRGSILGWVITTLIYHAAAHILGGKGDRNRMFALTAYASIPGLIQQILRFVSYWLLGSTPLTTTNVIELLVDYFNVFTIISLVLIGVAVMLNYGLTAKKAAFVALIPIILSLALGLFSLRMVNTAAQANPGGLFGMRGG